MAIDARFQKIPAGHIAAVVTVLEMRTPAPARPEHGCSDWTIETVEAPSAAFYLDLYVRVGAPHLWYSRLEMERGELAGRLRDPGSRLDVLMVEGEPCGILEFDFRDAGQCEIAFFGVAPELTGSGAARVLMNHAIRAAFSQPIERLWLNTNTLDHPRALDFYQRSGFTPVERYVEIAADPRLSGLVPRDSAPQVPIL